MCTISEHKMKIFSNIYRIDNFSFIMDEKHLYKVQIYTYGLNIFI